MGRAVLVALGLSLATTAARAAEPELESTDVATDPELRRDVRAGQSVFSLHGAVRVRGEGRGHPIDQSASAAGGVASRVRLGIDAELSVFRLRTNLQDAHVFGGPDDGAVIGDPGSSSTGLYEGYLEVHAPRERGTFVRVGRQVVQWGEGRLLGAQDWSIRGRSLDALRGRLFAVERLHVEALGALLTAAPSRESTAASYGVDHDARSLFGGLVGFDVHPLLRLELLGLGRLSRQSNPPESSSLVRVNGRSELVTTSLRAFGALSSWSYSVEGALQAGRAHPLGLDVPVLAYAGAARMARRIDELPLSPEPELGLSYASGDAPGTAKYTQFDPLLPNPIAYGLMDVVSWSNSLVAHAGVTLHVRDRLTVAPSYRYLGFASKNGEWVGGQLQPMSTRGSTSLALGHEVDLMVRWAPHRIFEARAGGALLVLAQGGKDRAQGSAEAVRPYGVLQLQLALE